MPEHLTSKPTQCLKVQTCREALARPASDEYRDHLIALYRSAGDEGRAMVIEALTQEDSYIAHDAVGYEIAINLSGYTPSQEETLAEFVREDSYSSIHIVLAHTSGTTHFRDLIEAQDRFPYGSTLMTGIALSLEDTLDEILPLMIEDLRNVPLSEYDLHGFSQITDPLWQAYFPPLSEPTRQRLIAGGNNRALDLAERQAHLILLIITDLDNDITQNALIDLYRHDADLKPLLHNTLTRLENPNLLDLFIEECEFFRDNIPSAPYLEGCPVYYFQNLGPHAQAAGPLFLELSHAANLDVRINALTTLSTLEYRPAEARFREALASEFLTEVIAGAYGLYRFGIEEAKADIQALAHTHWSRVTRKALSTLVSHWDEKQEIPTYWIITTFYDRNPSYCLSQRWTGPLTHDPSLSFEIETPAPRPERRSREPLRYQIGDDVFEGFDRGEWVGELILHRPDEAPRTLINNNIIEILPLEDGLLINSGLSDYGFNGEIFHLTQVDGEWHVREVTQSSAAGNGGLVEIAPRIYAVFSDTRQSLYGQDVAVFDIDRGMLGQAHCIDVSDQE